MALATQGLRDAALASAVGETEAGFVLVPPRPGSPLAELGVQGGERLFAVDGQPVHSVPEIQAALRKHALGETAVLRVGPDADHARDLSAKHVSDYPAG